MFPRCSHPRAPTAPMVGSDRHEARSGFGQLEVSCIRCRISKDFCQQVPFLAAAAGARCGAPKCPRGVKGDGETNCIEESQIIFQDRQLHAHVPCCITPCPLYMLKLSGHSLHEISIGIANAQPCQYVGTSWDIIGDIGWSTLDSQLAIPLRAGCLQRTDNCVA